MGDEKDAFYIVRKGDVIGIYQTFADCQAQAASSPLDPSISVYKGYGLSKETKSYLVSHGLQQAGFSISATDVQDGLFGNLSVCPFQDADHSSCLAPNPPKKPLKLEHYAEAQASVSPTYVATPAFSGKIQRDVDTGLTISSASPLQYYDGLNYIKPSRLVRPACVSAETSSSLPISQRKIRELKDYKEPQGLQQPFQPTNQSCTIEFDGASKGNPGLAGAGAILRATDGSQVWLLREGVGIATNNVAEYRSVLLGLRTALQKGFKYVKVRGDSLLVCNQIMGKWKTKNENMANLCKEALHLKKQFLSFTIEQVPREFNSAADAQANRATNLRDGQVEVEMTTTRA